jgi:hypothetical protein
MEMQESRVAWMEHEVKTIKMNQKRPGKEGNQIRKYIEKKGYTYRCEDVGK